MSTLSLAVDRLLTLGTTGHHPASAIAGVRTDSGTEVEAGGWAKLPVGDAPGVPMARETLLDLASVTKVASTTTLAMRLVAAGQLSLEAPARRYLPDFDGEGKDGVTVEQLLTHTAGLPPWWPLYCETRDRDTALERAQALPLAAKPGTEWRYSDLGLILAGHIVERITTLNLADAFRRLVAEPLGLTAVYGPVPAERAAAGGDSDAYEFGMIATGEPHPVPFTTDSFTGWRRGELRGVANDGNAAHALGGVAGHAGLFATVDDLLTLGAAVRGGDLVPHAVLARFATPNAVHPEQAVGFRCRRLEVGGQALTVLHHGGFTGTFLALAIERELVVAGGAMRLYGTLGPIPASLTGPTGGTAPDVTGLVPGTDIQGVLLDAAREALAD
ncbi:serine hydrolase domain-containing protein [Rugosimonospora acidiphila]|uniref:Serine hydrolase domain-containing protein n=1 Tax=Rugosimonospora acidiphila TaxID=556531 RepID=A0ABP9S507_9ACTN